MVHLIDAEGRELGQALGTRMKTGHAVGTLCFSDSCLLLCVYPFLCPFSLWISCWVSGSQFRTCGPTCATPGCSILSFLLLQRDRFSSFQIQDYWGGRGLSWLGSDVHPGHISCGQGPATLCMTPLWQLCVSVWCM